MLIVRWYVLLHVSGASILPCGILIFQTQWNTNNGKCGFCGDAYNAAVRAHEVGGKYANGIIGGTYRAGATIDIAVKLGTNHLGYFEFNICDNNNPNVRPTQECFDR